MKKILILLSLITILFFLVIVFFHKRPQVNQQLIQTLETFETLKESIAPQPTVIESDGLPNKHIINLAFVPQAPEKNWDQPWQDACEEAALLTVVYYYQSESPSTKRVVADLKKIIEYESNAGFTPDVNLTQIATIAQNLYGLNSQIINSPTAEDIKRYIANDVPVIVPANGKTLYKENKHFKSGGPWYHNLVILGYDDPKQKFIVHDVGTQFGAYYKYSYDLLIESIHDFPPTGKKEDIDLGSKNVLVLVK